MIPRLVLASRPSHHRPEPLRWYHGWYHALHRPHLSELEITPEGVVVTDALARMPRDDELSYN